MLRLDRLDESFRYDLDYPHIEDYVLFTRIAERFPSEVLAEPLDGLLHARVGDQLPQRSKRSSSRGSATTSAIPNR
jgi:hypothetical protein